MNSSTQVPSFETPTFVGTFALFLIGVPSNVIVIVVFSCSVALRKSHNTFIINLAIIDILCLCFLSPIITGSFLVDKGKTLKENQLLCNLAGGSLNSSYALGIFAMSLVAINRYLIIVHPAKARRIFTVPKSVCLVVLSWTLCTLVYLPPVLGWGGSKYDSSIHFCTIDVHNNLYFNLFTASCGVAIPSCITVVCYTGIFLKVRKSKRLVMSHQVQANDALDKKEIKLAFQLFLVIAIFYITWIPFMIVLNFYSTEEYRLVRLIFSALLSLNLIVNPFIYLYFNATFRAECIRMITCNKHSECNTCITTVTTR